MMIGRGEVTLTLLAEAAWREDLSLHKSSRGALASLECGNATEIISLGMLLPFRWADATGRDGFSLPSMKVTA